MTHIRNNRHVSSGWRRLIGTTLLALGSSLVAQAQEPFTGLGFPFLETINCYPDGVVPGPMPRTATPTVSGAALRGPITRPSSINGAVLTPQGNLKVLVIFAGFDEDLVNTSCGSYASAEWS